MFTIIVIVIGVGMLILPVIEVITLNDIMRGLGVLTIIIGVVCWLLAEHIDKK